MTRQALNKGTLNRLRRRQALYERVLPSLDLKRRQLIAERQRARRALETTDHEIRDGFERAAAVLPMLANRSIPLKGLVRVTDARVAHRNLLGVTLPELADVEVQVHPYSYLSKPHWVDRTAVMLRELAELQLRRQVQAERLRLLEQAERKAVQRVNLLDKVLIPRTREDIRRVQIALADAERSAVVRSKIAKRRHRRRKGAPA
jgi:V/A-type H+-transporting ATPase subunit D